MTSLSLFAGRIVGQFFVVILYVGRFGDSSSAVFTHVSRKHHNHTLQSNTRHHKEELQNTFSQMTSERQLK